MGKSTTEITMFNSYITNYQRVINRKSIYIVIELQNVIECYGMLQNVIYTLWSFGYSTQPWKIITVNRYIIYKWVLFSIAMLNNQRVSSKMVSRRITALVRDLAIQIWKDVFNACKEVTPNKWVSWFLYKPIRLIPSVDISTKNDV